MSIDVRAVQKVEIAHKRSSRHTTEFVTGALAAGPLPDGFFRFTLFRDEIPEFTEVFNSLPGQPGVIDISSQEETEISIYREDVVTLLLTPQTAIAMGKDLIARGTAALQDVSSHE